MSWQRASTTKLSSYNLNFGLEYDDSSFTTTSVYCRTVLEKTATTWYSDRFAANGGVFSNFTLKSSGASAAQTASNWPFYSYFYLNKGNTGSSFSTGNFTVANTGGNTGWTNFQSSQDISSITIWAPSSTIVSAPSVGTPSISSIGRTSANASFSSSANGQAPYSPYIDCATSNFSNIVSTISAKSGTFTGLTPNTTYYVRANDANDAGRSYSSVVSFKTTGNAPSISGVTVTPSRTSCYFVPSIGYDTNDSFSKVTVEYGLSTSYGSSQSSTSSKNITITNLSPNTRYYFKLTITSSQGRSNTWSSNFTTTGNPPTLSKVDIIKTTSKDITLKATNSYDTNSIFQNMHIIVDTDGWTLSNGSTRLKTVNILNEQFTIDDLKPGKKYILTISTIDNYQRESSTIVLNIKTKGGFKYNGKMSDTIKLGGKEVIGMKLNGVEII